MAKKYKKYVSQLRDILFVDFPGNSTIEITLVYIFILITYTIYNKTYRRSWLLMNTIPEPLVLANQWTIVLSVVIALLTQNVWILLFPLIFCLLSVFLKFHPMMILVKKFLKKPLNQYQQEDRSQLQFNQWMAISFLIVAVISYMLNWMILFNVATVMVGMAALIAIFGFCIGCFIRYRYQQWQFRRKKIV